MPASSVCFRESDIWDERANLTLTSLPQVDDTVGRHAWDEKANPTTLFSIILLVVTHLGKDVSGLRGRGPFGQAQPKTLGYPNG